MPIAHPGQPTGGLNINVSSQRIEAAFKMIEHSGGKLVGFYATMGEYD